MTLDEAIQHLTETLEDKNHEWACEECKKEHQQLKEWLKELKDRREGHAACEFCKHKFRLETERPCSICKHNFVDKFEREEE